MTSSLPMTVVKRRAAAPKLPAFATATSSLQHSTASAVGQLVETGDIVQVPRQMVVLTPQKPWVKDKVELTVYNAVFNIAGGPAPAIILAPRSVEHLGSVQVMVRNTAAGKMFVIEFLDRSLTGSDFAADLGPALHVNGGDFKLPLVVTSSGETVNCRISAKTYGPPNTPMAVAIKSIKISTVT